MEFPGFTAGCAPGATDASTVCAVHMGRSNTVINRLARNIAICPNGGEVMPKAAQLLWRQLEADLPDERCYTPELPF
jgi:hypothetical protein